MKKSLFLILLFVVNLNAFSQGHELGVGLNTGYSFFRGESSGYNTFVNGHGSENVYTNSPLGKKFTLSAGASVNYKYVTKSGFLFGAEVGYEDLRTKIGLTGYHDMITQVTEGNTYLNNHFLNATPFIGYRIPVKSISLDIIGGFDFAYSLDIKEYGNYKEANGEQVKFTKSRKDSYIDIDIRPRIQLNVNYKRYIFFAGASFGLANYYRDWDGGSPEGYMNTIRIGAQYRLF